MMSVYYPNNKRNKIYILISVYSNNKFLFFDEYEISYLKIIICVYNTSLL